MNAPYRPDKMQAAIAEAMRLQIEAVVEEEAKAAAKRVEERVRGMTGQIAAKVASMVDYQEMQNRIIITVRFPEKENG